MKNLIDVIVKRTMIEILRASCMILRKVYQNNDIFSHFMGFYCNKISKNIFAICMFVCVLLLLNALLRLAFDGILFVYYRVEVDVSEYISRSLHSMFVCNAFTIEIDISFDIFCFVIFSFLVALWCVRAHRFAFAKLLNYILLLVGRSFLFSANKRAYE